MPQIILVLHNIRSTHNVGSIFRTAEGFGVNKIVCSGYTPYPKLENDTRLPHIAEKLTRQIHKTALGAEMIVPFEYVDEIDSTLTQFKKSDMVLCALEQHPASISLREFTPQPNLVLILGEEVNGVPTSLLEQCDAIIEIPMQGQKESFNVSVSAGIALFQLTGPTT